MKKIVLLLVAATALIAGCASPGYYSETYGYAGDRDGDGVRNRADRRPDNPYRY
jgi:hypothetical protein